METKLANFKLPVDLIKKIDDIGSGNKTVTVIELLNQALCLREIPEHQRHIMYSSVKRRNSDEMNGLNDDPVYSRNLIDGLHI